MADAALVCRRYVPHGSEGLSALWSLRLPDGFLIECGAGPEGQTRAEDLFLLHQTRSQNEAHHRLIAMLVAAAGFKIEIPREIIDNADSLTVIETHDPSTGAITFETYRRGK